MLGRGQIYAGDTISHATLSIQQFACPFLLIRSDIPPGPPVGVHQVDHTLVEFNKLISLVGITLLLMALLLPASAAALQVIDFLHHDICSDPFLK
jgi:hypothetical protein